MNQKGQSLIEALIALGAAAIIVSAIAIVVITSVNNSDFSKYQNLATQYSQQGMEILKQKSESDWQSFSSFGASGSVTYCLNQDSTTLNPSGSGCTVNINNFFIRKVVIAQNDASCSGNARVTVSVSWKDGKCTSSGNIYCHSVDLNSCLANINGVQVP